MIKPTRGKYIGEILSRERQLASGLWIADKIKLEKKDNVAICRSVGEPSVKTCYTCHEKKICKSQSCHAKNKPMPIVAQPNDILHYKRSFGTKMEYRGKKYIVLHNNDIIAVEHRDTGQIRAVGAMIIIKLMYADKIGSIIVPDQAKLYSGEYWGEVVSVGPDLPYHHELLVGDKIVFCRNEGYKFKPFFNANYEELYAVKAKWVMGREKRADKAPARDGVYAHA